MKKNPTKNSAADIAAEKTAYKKKQRTTPYQRNSLLYVVPPGIEPGTQGFSVLCSTN